MAIAIKFFGGEGQIMEAAVQEDEEDGASAGTDALMPEAFHWQASHTPKVGNWAYATRIDCQGGLTDQGVDEYIRITDMWQDLLASDDRGVSSKKRHERSGSSESVLEMPLAKRIALRTGRPKCRTHWSMDEVKRILRHMHGPNAQYKSLKREEAVQAVMSGLTPVVVILGTVEGESFFYMLQQRLPGAGTTVLIMPPVALKQDTARGCELMGVECSAWSRKQVSAFGSTRVIVSLEKALSVELESYFEGLDAVDQLGSITVDECHLVVTASAYRSE